jgi:hypothetical protein
MLNLERPFQDAVLAFDEASGQLQIAPLAAVVFLMQRDVINQYKYALEHYLTVDLKAPFLQNSSLGTPYQKWAKFTNDDFENLFFAIGNLLRYTARLLDETLASKQRIQHEYGASKATSSLYISQLVGIRHGKAFVGVRCEENELLVVAPLTDSERTDQPARGRALPIDTEAARNEVLYRVQADGESELSRLVAIHEKFSTLCQQYYSEHDVIVPYDALHPSYCV